MTKSIITFLLLTPAYTFSQLPNTNQVDIWIMKIASENGIVRFENPKNITHQKGYENQPSFSSDGKTIYYTSRSDTSVKTTIYAYTLSSGQTKQVTFTNLSPYSPMTSPKGNGISALMVEEDSTQRIWQYPFNGTNPYPLFPKRDSIGYYTWVNAHSALVLVLEGKSHPDRFLLINEDGTEKMLAENIGRGMKVFGKGALFIQIKDSVNYLYWTDLTNTKELVRTPGKSEYMAIFKDYVLMASGGTIYGAKMKRVNGQIVSVLDFIPLQDLSPYGIKKITRITVSPDEKTIAMAVGME